MFNFQGSPWTFNPLYKNMFEGGSLLRRRFNIARNPTSNRQYFKVNFPHNQLILGPSWLSANLGFGSVRVCVCCVSVLTGIEL